MSAPANTPGQYLTGWEAIDVARMTGLKLKSPRHELREEADIDPLAAALAVRRGVLDSGRVFIDLGRLAYWERMRVAWTRIGGHYYCDEVKP